MHLFCNTACVITDCLYLILGQISGRKDTSGVTGVDTCQLDMLHNSRNKYVLAIADSICLTLGCMMQETVNQDRTIRSYTDSCSHIEGHRFIVMNNLHAAAAKYIGRTNHNRVTDLIRNL